MTGYIQALYQMKRLERETMGKKEKNPQSLRSTVVFTTSVYSDVKMLMI